MAEYIKREDLIKEMESVTNDITCPIHIAAEIDQIIALIPASDVVEVKHGKWDENLIGFCNVCLECGAIVERSTIKNHSGELNYCPNCGAKMEEEE